MNPKMKLIIGYKQWGCLTRKTTNVPKQKIFTVISHLFHQQGNNAIDMDQIINKNDTVKGNPYHLLKSKQIVSSLIN